MLADVFEIDGNTLKFTENSNKSILDVTTSATNNKNQSDADDLLLKYNEEPFSSCRHQHIGVASDLIADGFKDLRETDAGKLDAAGHNANLETMAAGLVHINDYKKAKDVSKTDNIY